MASVVHKFRAARFRQPSASSADLLDVLLPPPLPLIQLPDEPQPTRSGALDSRPMHLPVRRHLHPEPRNLAPEPNLVENRPELEAQLQLLDDAAVDRVRVYEYNRPEVFQHCGAARDTLVFESLFEGGNLQRADRVLRTATSQIYELYVHPDLQNSAYRQWFYFQVRNAQRGVVYSFSLVNLAKSGALFGAGLQPVVYSEIDAETHKRGWIHGGSHITYSASTASDAPRGANALSFHYEFAHDDDCVYFACLQPYSYSDLVAYLDTLERDPVRSALVRRTELCQTIAQNACDLLSITSPPMGSPDSLPRDDKKLIVLSARVHPGEPNASWMMKGMLDYLTGPSSGAAVLRNHFIFKVVPMLNPDGVINGNTRVNLAGWDLNRKWSNPIEKLFPTIFHLKKLLTTWQTRDRVAIYCDLHGHSINRNIFMYGCFTKRSNKKQTAAMNAAVHAATSAASVDSTTSHSPRASRQDDPRVFPLLIAKHSAFFSFSNCDFKVHKSKLNTARVVVHQELGVVHSYTLEASFCGPDFGVRKNTQLSAWDLEDMGRAWCQNLLLYFGLLPHVRALDQRRELEAREASTPASSASKAAFNEPTVVTPDAALLELQGDLLGDCEAAISELFASVDLLEDTATAEANDPCDSDVSGAEDAIPPNDGPEDDGSAVVSANKNGYASAPDEASTKAIANKKKLKRCKSTRRKKSASAGASASGGSKKLKKKKSRHRQRTQSQVEDPAGGEEEEVEEGNGDGHGDAEGERDEGRVMHQEGEDAEETDGVSSPRRKTKKKKAKHHQRRRRKETTNSIDCGSDNPASTVSTAADCGDGTTMMLKHVVLVLPDVSGSSSSSRVQRPTLLLPTPGNAPTTRIELPVATPPSQRQCDSNSGSRSNARRPSKLLRTVMTEPLELPLVTNHPPLLAEAGSSGRNLLSDSKQKRPQDPPEGDEEGGSSSSSDCDDSHSVVSAF